MVVANIIVKLPKICHRYSQNICSAKTKEHCPDQWVVQIIMSNCQKLFVNKLKYFLSQDKRALKSIIYWWCKQWCQIAKNILEILPKYFLREDKRALKSIIQINGWRESFGEFATNLVISSHRWKLARWWWWWWWWW